MTDKSTIFISLLSFITFTFGLMGIDMLLRNICYPDWFLQQRDCGKSINDSNLNNSARLNNIYFKNSNLHNYDKSYKTGFSDLLADIYDKRRKYVLLSFFILLLTVFYILFKNIFLSLFMTTMFTGIAGEFFGSVLKRKKETLDIQLIEFIMNMIIMLRAGKEIRQIFKESIICIKDPLKGYLKNLINEVELNISMDSALDNFATGVGSKEACLLANAIKINRKIGGNLLVVLENIIKTLQQNLKIKSQIKTQTAQNQFSSNIIALFPLAGFIGMYFFLNSMVKDFLSSATGTVLLIAGALLEFSGFFVIRKILKEDLI